MAEKPPLSRDIEAVLDRCVGEMRERLVGELKVAETETDRLEILARFSREIGNVRGKVSGRAGISIGQRWALIGAGLAVFGAGVVTASLWPRPQAVGTTAVEAPRGDDVAIGAGEPVPVRPPLAPIGVSAPGTPEASRTKGDAADNARAESDASKARVEADVSMNSRIRASLLKLYGMFETVKDEFGNPLSDARRKELEGVVADFEAAFRDRGATDTDIAKLKEEAKNSVKGSVEEVKPDAKVDSTQDMARIKAIMQALITNKKIGETKTLSSSERITLNNEKEQLRRRLGLTYTQMMALQEEVRKSLAK